MYTITYCIHFYSYPAKMYIYIYSCFLCNKFFRLNEISAMHYTFIHLYYIYLYLYVYVHFRCVYIYACILFSPQIIYYTWKRLRLVSFVDRFTFLPWNVWWMALLGRYRCWRYCTSTVSTVYFWIWSNKWVYLLFVYI